jgi:hypothetical protein
MDQRTSHWEMLKNSFLGIFQLGLQRSEFAAASASQRITSLFALGQPYSEQETLMLINRMLKNSFPAFFNSVGPSSQALAASMPQGPSGAGFRERREVLQEISASLTTLVSGHPPNSLHVLR